MQVQFIRKIASVNTSHTTFNASFNQISCIIRCRCPFSFKLNARPRHLSNFHTRSLRFVLLEHCCEGTLRGLLKVHKMRAAGTLSLVQANFQGLKFRVLVVSFSLLSVTKNGLLDANMFPPVCAKQSLEAQAGENVKPLFWAARFTTESMRHLSTNYRPHV